MNLFKPENKLEQVRNGLTGMQVAEVIYHSKTASQAADITAPG